jgi:hypothetical protein
VHLLAATLIAFALLVPARYGAADDEVVWWQMNDGDETYYVVEFRGNWFLVVKYEDETYFWYAIPESDNPSPDDGTTTPGDWDSRLALLKQAGGGGLAGPALEQTPLGKLLTGKGKGIGPLHNPSGDSPSGQSPSSIGFANSHQEYEEFWAGAGYPLGPGFDGNGGSIGGQIKEGLKHGKKKGSGGNNDSKPSDGGLWDDAMPGPPELVNPAWQKNAFNLMGPLTGAGAGGSTKELRTTQITGRAGMVNLNPGSSVRSKHVGGATMLRSTSGLTGGLTSGSRAVTSLKLSK